MTTGQRIARKRRELALSGEDSVEVAAERDGQVFSARLTCPLTDDIRLLAVFYQGESRSTQTMGSYLSLYSDSLPMVTLNWAPGITQTRDGSTLNRGTWAGIDYGNVVTEELAAQVRVESIRVGLFRDRQLVCWMTETDDGDAGIWAAYQLPRELPLIDGANYCVAAVVLDSVGRELVWSSDFMRWNADSRDFEGDPVYSPDYWDKTLWSY